MLTNYIKIAWRSLLKNRVYSVINIFGLGLGLAVGFVLLYWVNNEYTMNAFHKKADRIYQVTAKFKYDNQESTWESVGAPVAAYAREHMPDIEKIVRIRSNYSVKQAVKVNDRVFLEDKLGYTENEFFEIFDFPIVKGSSEKPFATGLTVVITENIAKKYFGNENPVGKIITFRDTTIQVSAVMKDFPASSSLQFDMLFSLELQKLKFRGNGQYKTIDTDWGNFDYNTFALVKEGADREKASQTIRGALLKVNTESKLEGFPFRPLSKIYLYKADGSKGRLVMVEIFLIVGVFILLIAAINYINLVTARATQRIKEISMRKILGAEKRQLFVQFFIETGLLIFISMLTAFVLIQVLIPVYGSITDTNFHINIFNWQLWKVLLMMIGGIWLLSGLYPVLLLSSFRPVQALRGTGIFANTGLIRKSLVVLQFVVSISLALGTIFIHRQMSFIRNTDLALNPKQVIVFETWRLKGNGPTAFKDQLERMAGVTNYSIANASVFDAVNSNMSIEWPGRTDENKFHIADFQVDKNFLQFFEIKMKEGKDFDNVSEGSKQWVLNETAIRKMGLQNPVGQPIKYRGEQGTIIGVVKDFHFRSMRDEIMPLLMQYNTEEASVLYARVTPQETKKVLAAATQVWKKYEAIMPMDYHLLDEQIAQQYDSETKASYLFDAFAIVTMLISCLGLFGLTTYSAERRVKEIGIRKVLGAGVGRIAVLLSKEFVRLVIIATVIAIPIVWYSMTRLLENFAFRTALSWWVFAIAALGAIILALITMSFQAIKAGMSNPVKSLRME